MPRIITAGFTSNVPKNAPGEFMYLPVGENRINATVNGKPGEITVKVPAEKGDMIAAGLQAALDKRLASTVRPRLAFDHSRTGPASAHPVSFRFGEIETPEGKKTGIILAANWSHSGKTAIEGGDYGYFSPTFLIDDDGFPSGLPDKGEIGSLVDEPAFRSIGLVAAADTDPNNQETTNTMSKLIFAALSVNPDSANAETAAVQSIETLKTENATVKASLADKDAEIAAEKAKVEAAEAKVTALETAAATAKTEGFKVKIEAAVTAGKIAPKDEETKTQALDLLEANEALGTKFLDGLAAKDPSGKIVEGKSAEADKTVNASEVLASEIAAGR